MVHSGLPFSSTFTVAGARFLARSRSLALASTGVVFAVTWPTGARRAYFLAFACYAAMIAVFFLFNAPVNEALDGWTAATLPTNWSTYRLRWEIGHAFAAVLAVIAFVALMRQWKREPTN